jgi:arylsulfatase A-like enzyme
MKKLLLAINCLLLILNLEAAGPVRPPNIVVILTDDQGYADISFNPEHPKEVSTPHMDALAREGVFFKQAYTSGQVCSPTRTGLMLGRYQQREGVYTGGEGGRGIDPKIPIFPALLPKEYTSMAVGKWHLGLDEDYPELKWHPVNRGFKEAYNFMGRGGHDYFEMQGVKGGETSPMYRGKERIADEGYLTTRLSEEAVAFIGRNKEQPFFLYLAYNAVHAPAQAPKEDIERIKKQFPEISEARAILAAMLHHLDLGVGAVVKKLKDENLWDNTLLVFLTDNGGSKGMSANNGSLKGFKSSYYEGGIRTPFVVSWPAKFKGGRTIETPVISLDILPTALEAAGISTAGKNFDGKSLLPLLTGKTKVHHQTLYWSSAHEGDWAIRHGDWKLHGIKGARELINLAADPGEKNNLTTQNPEKVKELAAMYDAWLAQMAGPMTKGAAKRWSPEPEKKELTEREKKRMEKKKAKTMEKKTKAQAPKAGD